MLFQPFLRFWAPTAEKEYYEASELYEFQPFLRFWRELLEVKEALERYKVSTLLEILRSG